MLIPEFVGYGMSGGSPSERGCQDTADAAYEYLVETRGIEPERIVVGGWSLGGAVAVDLASRTPVAGLIMFSSFTSGVDMAHRIVPFLPVSLLLRHRFDNIGKIRQRHLPDPDRPRPSRPARPVRDGGAAGQSGEGAGDHALDRRGRPQRLLRGRAPGALDQAVAQVHLRSGW